MRSLSIFSLLLAASIGSHAQTISIPFSNAQFNVAGCASPSGTNQCYEQASANLAQGERVCNGTAKRQAGGNCEMGYQASFFRDVVGCLTEGCWNRALSCEYQYMLGAYVHDIFYVDSISGEPPFWVEDYGGLPGSCVCNVPYALAISLTDDSSLCQNLGALAQCDCCVAAAGLKTLQTICPHNSLQIVAGFADWVQLHVRDSMQNCAPVFQQSNWESVLDTDCPQLGINQSVSEGYLNPLSLPTNFPTSGPSLSNIPGSVTALSQYNVTGSTLVHSWGQGMTSTYTFSPYNAAAAASTGRASGSSATPQITTMPPVTTTINGQATTIAGSVATVSHSNAGRAFLPSAVGLLAALLLLMAIL